MFIRPIARNKEKLSVPRLLPKKTKPSLQDPDQKRNIATTTVAHFPALTEFEIVYANLWVTNSFPPYSLFPTSEKLQVSRKTIVIHDICSDQLKSQVPHVQTFRTMIRKVT